mmetsp:Transcript_17475/g.20161  ORF Transcript_17475/g.20161 Transcript_17475/m.20161 type:complete len:103 (-) Transcript_17475:27-335(-)
MGIRGRDVDCDYREDMGWIGGGCLSRSGPNAVAAGACEDGASVSKDGGVRAVRRGTVRVRVGLQHPLRALLGHVISGMMRIFIKNHSSSSISGVKHRCSKIK